MNLLKELTQNKFLLILMSEKDYISKLLEIVKTAEKTATKICYVCLNKTYLDVVDGLKDNGININNFFFVDALSSHYKEPEPAVNCIFISSPSDLNQLKDAVSKVIKNENCSALLFDTISTLLIYQQASSIVNLTHTLVSESVHEDVKKLFIMIKDDEGLNSESKSLANDLEMFADKRLDM